MNNALSTIVLGVGAGTLVAFISIPLSLLMDYKTGHLTNFIQMWEALGVTSAISFFIYAILVNMKKRPERFFKSKFERDRS